MYEHKEEKAILVALNTKSNINEVEEHLNELEFLAETAGVKTLFKVIQNKNKIDPAFYIGKGKAEEISSLAQEYEIDVIIFDEELTPSQTKNLEKIINKKVIDRSGLILDIFASRAKTVEAKTQVELAQLEYLLPRLTRAWTHLSKQYGGIGTRGPGETQIETDRRLVKRRIITLKEKLEQIDKQREIRKQSRRDFFKASLVGYTNAGKSTLMNCLTNANVFAENKLFATLDPTTRLLELDKNVGILITDTVGFIRKLPVKLIASFRSTLQEIAYSDFILHVIDVANPNFNEQIEIVHQTLLDLKCDLTKEIKIFNKIDLLPIDKLQELLHLYPDDLFISALKGFNINKLKNVLLSKILNLYKRYEFKTSYENSRFISFLYNNAYVYEKIEKEDCVILKVFIDEKILNNIKLQDYESTYIGN